MGFDFDMITSLLPSHCSFTFVLGHGIFGVFFGEFQYPVSGCSTASCSFGVLTGEDGHTSFYSAIFSLVVVIKKILSTVSVFLNLLRLVL